MRPVVTHLEPYDGHNGGGDDAEDGDHSDTRYRGSLEGLKTGIECNHVEERADEISPFRVGSVSGS